jgi:hypothetical protein
MLGALGVKATSEQLAAATMDIAFELLPSGPPTGAIGGEG